VTQNSNVLHGLSWQNVIWSFGTDNPAANWHPLTWISHMTDVELYGMDAAGHHLTSVLVMLGNVVLLFFVLLEATGRLWRSAAVAALWAAHPLNVESVAWIAERKEVLSLLFLFLTLLAYLRYVKEPASRLYAGVAVLFALGLMGKVMIMTLPVALLLWDYWPLERVEFERARKTNAAGNRSVFALVVEKLPLFLLSVAAGLTTVWIHKREGALTSTMPLAWRWKNAVYSYALYLWKMVWPAKLAVFYPHPENRLALWQVGVAGLVLIATSAAVWRFRRKKYLAVSWLWYLITLFPMIGILQSGRQAMGDRHATLPMIGLLIAVVWLVAEWVETKNLSPIPVGAGVTAIVLALAVVSHRQLGYWKNSETLFRHALAVTVNNGIAENNLGSALMERGEANTALPHFQAAVRYTPDLGNAHYNLAVALHRQNQLAPAAEQYRLAIALAASPAEAAQAHNNLGVIFLQSNSLDAAKAEFDQAIALNPAELNSYLGRGQMELQLGWMDGAIADFEFVSKRVASPVALYWLGRAEEAKGEIEKAKAAYQAAVQLAPGMTDAQAQLEKLQRAKGR
jgi:tetratricopeptide (TPR) repeat protein